MSRQRGVNLHQNQKVNAPVDFFTKYTKVESLKVEITNQKRNTVNKVKTNKTANAVANIIATKRSRGLIGGGSSN